MTPERVLWLLWSVVDGSYDGSPERWVTADEVARRARFLSTRVPSLGDEKVTAQTMGRRLSRLAREGLLEARDECGYREYRVGSVVRGLLRRAG